MTVLQVPAGKDEGPRGLPNLLKSGKKEEDGGGEKKENGDDEEELEGKGRDSEDMQDSVVLEKGMIVKLPWSILPLLQLLLQGSRVLGF